MVKLIVSDLDGTLLDDKKQLPPDFREILYFLKERGIVFAIATGRSFQGMENIFGDMINDIFFICDNGAFIVENGKPIDVKIIEKPLVNDILNCISEIGNVDALVCGKNGTYYTHCSDRMSKMMENFYSNTKFVDNLYDIDDDIFKVSICDFHNPLINSFPYFKSALGDKLSIFVSGAVWTDIMCTEVDKGYGVQALQDKLNVPPSRTACFGDFYNDIPMLLKADISFAMSNAEAAVKNNVNYIAKSCNEHGVTQAIRNFFL